MTPVASGPGTAGGTLDTTGRTAPSPVAAPTAPVTVDTDLPCEVAEVMAKHCWNCHGGAKNFGAPMSLVNVADFAGMGPLTMDQAIGDLLKMRINGEGGKSPMPPPSSSTMSADEIAVLSGWVDGGMVAGTGGCNVATPTTQEAPRPMATSADEVCYKFMQHGIPVDGDTSPHIVQPTESYVNYYYSVPWTEPVVATRWQTVYDKTEVLHHWLMYDIPVGLAAPGAFEETIGSHIAEGLVGEGVQLVGGWAVGGGDEKFPEGVGLRMPDQNGMLMIEWHLFNTTGGVVEDNSGVEICVVPERLMDPKKIAGLTWVGTENFNGPAGMQPGVEHKFGGTCDPGWQADYGAAEEITIVKFLPHMHTIGKHMDTWIIRADGTEEHVFSKPFQFDLQISYDMDPPLVMKKGDRIRAECTFFNDTSNMVRFGPSTNDEMCYQFTVAYPAGALDNRFNDGAWSLTGANNTCIGAF